MNLEYYIKSVKFDIHTAFKLLKANADFNEEIVFKYIIPEEITDDLISLWRSSSKITPQEIFELESEEQIYVAIRIYRLCCI